MVSLIRRFLACSCGLLVAICSTQAFAEPDAGTLNDQDSHWSYDEVIANVPRNQAETPAVALAKINIALYHAKQLTEERLCTGKWTPRGTLLRWQNSEFAETWLFQSFRKPETLVCPDITRAEYFMEMSRHLPSWISVRPAGQAMTFKLGQAFTDGQHSLAARY